MVQKVRILNVLWEVQEGPSTNSPKSYTAIDNIKAETNTTLQVFMFYYIKVVFI